MSASIEYIKVNGREYHVETLIDDYNRLKKIEQARPEFETQALHNAYNSEELKPFQAELIRLQEYMEREKARLLILFEGRMRRERRRHPTRYPVHEPKHYRVVALGKPTEEQRTQWFYQKYIGHFPCGGEIVLFDRSWYNRAMVERVFGFCTEKEYEDFMNGVSWFEEDLVMQGTILVKLYSV